MVRNILVSEVDYIVGGWNEYCDAGDGTFQIYDNTCQFYIDTNTCLSVVNGDLEISDSETFGTMTSGSGAQACPISGLSLFPQGSLITIKCTNIWEYCTGKIG